MELIIIVKLIKFILISRKIKTKLLMFFKKMRWFVIFGITNCVYIGTVFKSEKKFMNDDDLMKLSCVIS